jgi:hypothetical protein
VFTERCCVEDQLTGLPVCRLAESDANQWLGLLTIVFGTVRVAAFFFGPLMLSSVISAAAREK